MARRVVDVALTLASQLEQLSLNRALMAQGVSVSQSA